MEQAWEGHIACTNHHNTDNTRITQLLRRVYIPALHRSARLHRDFSGLNVAVPENPEGTVQDIVAHITDAAVARPHVLLAYGWILYMALFNGGRWIRKQLASAGPGFWGTQEFETTCLSFWHFDGYRSEEDWKQDFRARVTEAGNDLTEEEVRDVVAEAKAIFCMCKSIVVELDSTTSREQPMQLLALPSLTATSELSSGMPLAKAAREVHAGLLHLLIHGFAAVIAAYFWVWFMT